MPHHKARFTAREREVVVRRVVDEGEEILAPYRSIAEPVADLTHVGAYIEEQSALDPLFAEGQRYF